MSLPSMTPDTTTKVVSWAITFALIGALVYYFPGVFLGLVAGWQLGVNKDKIQDWFEKNSPKTP